MHKWSLSSFLKLVVHPLLGGMWPYFRSNFPSDDTLKSQYYCLSCLYAFFLGDFFDELLFSYTLLHAAQSGLWLSQDSAPIRDLMWGFILGLETFKEWLIRFCLGACLLCFNFQLSTFNVHLANNSPFPVRLLSVLKFAFLSLWYTFLK